MPKSRKAIEKDAADPLLPAVELTELDGLENILTGMGVLGRDKREATLAVVDTMTYDGLSVFYRANDLAGRIIDLPAEDMTREGFDVKVEGDEELSEEIGDALEELGLEPAIEQAIKWQRLYGGAAILIGVNDGEGDISRPIDFKKIKNVNALTVLDAWECRPIEWQENPLLPAFGTPTMYMLNPHGISMVSVLQRVHASRVMRFCGPLSNRRQLRQANTGINQGWGDSVLLQIARLIRDYDGAWGGIGHILQDFAQSIYKLSGLAAAQLSDKDQTIKRRMQIINYSRSLIQATLLDKDLEDYEVKAVPLSGVSETMREFMSRVSAGAGMPTTKLFGISPGGMNATGDSDDRSWYDKVKAMQKRQVKPQLCQFLKIFLSAKEGPTNGVEPEQYTPVFRSLWQSTDVEKALIRLQVAQTAQIYAGLGAATAEDIAESHLSGDEFNIDLTVDLERVADNAEAEAAVREATQTATVSNLEEHGQTTPPKPTAAGGKADPKKSGGSRVAAPQAVSKVPDGFHLVFGKLVPDNKG